MTMPLVKVTNQRSNLLHLNHQKLQFFLDTKIEVQSNRPLSMGLFCKSTASFQYLQHDSYHPAHVTTSLPKSWFVRIRRICSYIKNYKHATQFIKHSCRRGYSEAKFKAICENVQKMSSEELINYRKKDKSNRVTLVLPFHHKYRGIQQVLQKPYNKKITCNPDLKQIFPDPPMISFRRAPNI